MAFAGAMSEIHHDEGFGWDVGPSIMERLHVTLIRDREDSERMTKRLLVTADVLRGSGALVAELATSGESRLARMCSLQQHLDYVAYYLAIARGVDPSRSPVLQQFRQRYNSPS